MTNCLGLQTVRLGGDLSREEVGVKKFIPFLESPGKTNFVPAARGVQKVFA